MHYDYRWSLVLFNAKILLIKRYIKIADVLKSGTSYEIIPFLIWISFMYPDIIISLIFGVRISKINMLHANYKWYFSMDVPQYLKNYVFWGTFVQIYIEFIQHIVWIRDEHTPTFQKACILRYICPNTYRICATYSLSLP